MHIIAIIQARLGSSRLPGKSLKTIHNKSMFEHIIERLQATQTLQRIVLATTGNAVDDPLVDLAERLGLETFRGSEQNVLDRFHGAASKFGAEVIVRVCADDPFKDPAVIDHAVRLFQTGGYDYCSNTLKPTYPEGIDIEVFRFTALDRAHREATLDSEKEHVTPYIWKNPEKFHLHNFTFERNLHYMRWTVDYECDLEFTREIYRRLYPQKRIFLMQDILDLLDKEPQIAKMNAGIIRNEGYHKSIAKELKQ